MVLLFPIQSLDWEDLLEEEMATYSSIRDCEIPSTEEPGGLYSTGSQRVRCDVATKPAAAATTMLYSIHLINGNLYPLNSFRPLHTPTPGNC